MITKTMNVLKTRGIVGTTKLLGSYGWWYWNKWTQRDRKFLRQLNGYQMLLSLDDPGLSTTIGRGGQRERDQSKVLQQELNEGMTVLDLGANLGYYALMEAVLVGSRGKVYAIEPVPANFQFLVENVKLNGFADRVETFHLAVSDKDGIQKLYLSKLSNLNTLFPDGASGKQSMTGETIDVQTMEIGSFLKGKKRIDLIRMDIEGAEVEVFNGLVRMLQSRCAVPCRILFETHRSKYTPEHSLEKPLSEMFAAGYYVKRLISNSDDGKKWAVRGYRPDELIFTDGMMRGIYSNVDQENALDLICRAGGVRAALLEFKGGI